MKEVVKKTSVRYLITLAKTSVVAAAAFAAFNLFSTVNPYSLSYNISESIPKGLYLVKEAKPSDIKVGDIGCFLYEAPTWAQERNYFPPRFKLCKPVFAGVGASFEVKDGRLHLAQPSMELAHVATFSSTDGKGRELKVGLPSTGTIPEGYVLMLAPEHNNSFDSRYLGLMTVTKVRFTAHPLLTWSRKN